MNSAWTIFVVIYLGLKVGVCAYSDDKIGCYNMEYINMIYNATFENNSAHVCKRHCFEGENRTTVYAGVWGTVCYCFDKLNGGHVTENECSVPCLSRPDDFCGGTNRVSVYNASRTTTPYPTTTAISTTDNISTNGSSASNLSNDGAFPVQFIIILGGLVVVNFLVIMIILIKRLRIRQIRRKEQKATENPPNALHGSHIEHNENEMVASRQDDVDTEYDTTITSRPRPLPSSASRFEDGCSRLKISKVSFNDPTYSHSRNHQDGACAILETNYSYFGRNEPKTKWINNEQSNIPACDYDQVQFDLSYKVRSDRTGLNFENCNDDVYDKLQYRK